jgi:ABC-type bacteriocin/lantibiotic exporter with double-glycine peptidase domain
VEDLRRALALIGREYRGRFVILVLVALASSGLEVVSAGFVYLLLALVTDPDAPLIVPLLGDLSALLPLSRRDLLIAVVAGFAGFLALRSIFSIAATYVTSRIVQRLAARLSTRMLTGYLSLPYRFHLGRNSADLIRNAGGVTRDVATGLLASFVSVIAEAVLLLGMLALMLGLAPVATLLAITVIGTASITITRIIQPALVRLGEITHTERKRSTKAMMQALHGIRDVRMLGLEGPFAKTYQRSADRTAAAANRRAVVRKLPGIVLEVALLAFILAFFTLTVVREESTSEVLPVLGLFAYAGRRLQPSIQTMISAVNELQSSRVPLADLAADLATIRAEAIDIAPVAPLPFERELRLEGVSFRYDNAHRDALTDVDLIIRRGETIGVCGSTGGGKTTLVDLLSGLIPPGRGRITIDDADLAGNERAWQAALGVVPQAVFLIDESLRENIALGVPPSRIDAKALEDAVDLAQLRDFIEDLPDGLDTVIGERGVRVSGGQRQRIAIARALYRRPSVLVFDEGTSALDNLTERELMEALARLRGSHTIILVAHRLSTIRDADRIVFVEGGRIAGIGTYAELEATNDAFRRLSSASAA